MPTSVFFDLDGTLTDPKQGITRSIQYAMHQLGVNPPEPDELTWCIGPPLLGSFTKLLGAEHAENALELYRERFSREGWQENNLYPGILGVLSELVRKGHTLYMATSKPHVFAHQIARHFAIDKYFAEMFGAELDGTLSEKAELLHFAMKKTNSDSSSWMIGDRKFDIHGANSNGLNSIGVTYGYGSKDELHAAGARRFAASPIDILNFFE